MPPRTLQRSLPVFLVACAFFLRVWDLGRTGFWYDEILQVQIARGTFAEFIAGLELHAAMPLDYVLERVVSTLGTNELLLRFAAAAASTLAVAVLYRLGKALFGRREGTAAAAFLAASSFAVLYAHEARPYSLYMLFAMGSFYWMYRALVTNKLLHWLFYGVCIAGAVLSHLFALFVVMTQGLFLIGGLALRVLAPQRARLFGKITRRAIGAGILVAALFLAALWLTPNAQFVWGSALRFFAFLLSPQFVPPSAWTGLAPGETPPLLSWDFIYSRILENFSGGGPIATGLFVWLGLAGLTAIRRKPWETILLVVWALVPSALIFMFLGHRGTLFATRYLIASLPAWLLMCGVGTIQLGRLAGRLAGNSALVRRAAWLVIAGLFLATALDRTLPVIAAPKEEWRTAGKILEANVKQGDAVIAPGGTSVVYFYAPTAREHEWDAQVVPQIAAAGQNASRVWLVLNRYVFDPGGEIQAWLDGRGAVFVNADSGIRVYYWRAGADTAALLADAKTFQLPPSAYAYKSLGDQFAQEDDLPTAVGYFSQALAYSATEGESAEVNVAWGEAQRRAGELGPAVEKYRAALASDADSVTAWVGLGRAYLEQNQLPAATEAFHHALALDSHSYHALFFLAATYEAAGQSALAQEYYGRAGQIIPELVTPP